MEINFELLKAGLMVLNSTCAIGCGIAYYWEHRRRCSAEDQNAVLRYEHSVAAVEIVSLKKTMRSLHDHNDRLSARAKLLAAEVQSDERNKTRLWKGRKPTVFDRGGWQ